MSHNNSWVSEFQQLVDEVRQYLNYLINSRQVLKEVRGSWDSESQDSLDSLLQQLIDEVRQDLNCLINKRQDLEEMRSSWDSESQGSWDSAFQQSIYEVRQYLNYFNRQQVLEEARSRLNQLSGDDRMIMVNVFIPSEEFNIETSNGDQLSCAICIDDLLSKEIIRTLPCNHRFHVKCIDKWLQSHNTCPMCRAPVIDDYFVSIS